MYIRDTFVKILKMNTPGVGNKKQKFKQLLGWGKNERTPLKRFAKKRSKLSRKLRDRRTRSNKVDKSNVSRRKPRRKKI